MNAWAKKLQSLNQPMDGCTMSPDGNWRECCDEHDYHYMARDVSRFEADKRLGQCISRRGFPVFGVLYFMAVRVFGAGFWNKAKFSETQTEGLLHG